MGAGDASGMAQSASSERLLSTTATSVWYVLSTATPVSLLTIFAAVHIQNWLDSGSLTGLGLALQESVLIVLVLIRRRPKESLNTPGAWLAAIIGSYGILLLRPNGYVALGEESIIVAIQLAAAALAIVTSLSLGRSFGIVAANRGIKTEGAYRFVRHPIYASYLIGYFAYLIAAISVWNVLVLTVSLGFQVRRMNAEESVLEREPEYRDYVSQVRYRLIPGIY